MSKTNKQIVIIYILLFILAVAQAYFCSKITILQNIQELNATKFAILHNTQEPIATKIIADDISKFEYLDINSPYGIETFYYSFIPDGSGIIYGYKKWTGYNKYPPLGFTFHFLDFKTKKQSIIYEINFVDEIDQEVYSLNPFIYWLSPELVVLGGDKFSGLCGPENSVGLAVFDLKSRKFLPVTYVDSTCSENGELYKQKLIQLYDYLAENNEDLKIFSLNYSTSYSKEAYLFLEGNNTIHVFIDTWSTSSIESDYRLKIITPGSFYINEDIDIGYIRSKQRIYSRDKEYYFMFTSAPSESDLNDSDKINPFRETIPEEYIEIYSWDDKPIKKVLHDFSGLISSPSAHPTGYIDFWSYDNKIVLIKAMDGGVYYRVYFIDPEAK